MKLNAISIAIILAGIAGVASAAGQSQALPEVNVTAAGISACTPPNDTTGHACDSYNEFLSANFTPREIGMLFGCRTCYPESLTGGIDRLKRRYEVMLQQYVAAHSDVDSAASVAVE